MSARPLALVTGARRGIGAAISVCLAQHGFDIALTDLDPEGGEAVLSQIQSHGGRARLFVSDLSDIATHAQLVEDVANWGGHIQCLVNNAGIGSPQRGDLLALTPQAFDTVLGVNLRGTFFLTQAVARHMLATGPRTGASIVSISSVSAEMASIERAEYCISKAGLAMLTKLYALRLAQAGIGVFEIRPGIIRTPLTAAVASRYEQRITSEGLVPMHRWGEPQDVAQAVASLANGTLAFATGSVLNVDGGLSIQRF